MATGHDGAAMPARPHTIFDRLTRDTRHDAGLIFSIQAAADRSPRFDAEMALCDALKSLAEADRAELRRLLGEVLRQLHADAHRRRRRAATEQR